jgi:hypothetical protein
MKIGPDDEVVYEDDDEGFTEVVGDLARAGWYPADLKHRLGNAVRR